MIKVGIDTSTTATAIVVKNDHRLLEFKLFQPKEKDIIKRSSLMLSGIDNYIDYLLVKHREIVFGVEGASFMSVGKRDKLIMLMGHVFYNLLQKGQSVRLLPPSTIKKQFTGNGRAKKEEVINTLPLPVKEKFIEQYKKIDDLADAFAIASII